MESITRLIVFCGGEKAWPPAWAAAARKVVIVQPSSAAAERVFSMLKSSFRDQQDNSLQHYIRLLILLMWQCLRVIACKAYACMHIMIELARCICLHKHELVYVSQLSLPANARLVCRTETEHFHLRCEGLLSDELSVAIPFWQKRTVLKKSLGKSRKWKGDK